MPSLQPSTNGLHAIIDVEVAARAGWTPVDLATACLEGGARVIQLRAKALAGGTFLELASQLHHLTLSGGGVLIVNDRADIARLADAEGVHVGQDDLSPAAARAILGTDAVVGLSTHTEQQVGRAVLEPISYVAIGPVFETSTKATGYAAVGLEAVMHAATLAARRGLGLIAIGGITLGRTRDVLRAGATGVAVITDLLDGNDPEARTRAYVSEFASRGKV
jgi:thiamine-phosphate pyrophosphorylase